MRHEHLYHQLLLYLNRDGLKELWKILVAGAQDLVAGPVSPTGLHRGLLGIMLDRTVVWLNRAAALGRVTVSPLPSPMETLKGEEGEGFICEMGGDSTPHVTLNILGQKFNLAGEFAARKSCHLVAGCKALWK